MARTTATECRCGCPRGYVLRAPWVLVCPVCDMVDAWPREGDREA